MTKRKTYQTLWELESIYHRACRITGSSIDTNFLHNKDPKECISLLKRKIVSIILEV